MLVGKARHSDPAARVGTGGFGRRRSGATAIGGTACPRAAAPRPAPAGASAVARASAARGDRASSGFGLPGLRRYPLCQARRGRDRDLGEDPGSPQSHPPYSAEAQLPVLRMHRASANARSPDRKGPARSGPGGQCRRQQIPRRTAALPAIGDPGAKASRSSAPLWPTGSGVPPGG